MTKEPRSNNFSAEELRCRCLRCNRLRGNRIDPFALAALQQLRFELGHPIILSSAYRCAKHPDEAKKSRPGYHHRGLAFDIVVGWGAERMRIIELAVTLGFKGFGFAESFIHLDYRDNRLTSWGYR